MADRIADRDAQVHDLLDRVHTSLSQLKYDEALRPAREAVALAPRSAAAWRELGSACGYAGRAQEMRDAFERALRLAVTPDEEVETWFARGNAENNCDQWADALRSFERVAELEPDWGVPWLMMGMVLGNMGTFIDRRYHAEAIVALDRALAQSRLRDIDRRVAFSLKSTSLFVLGRGEEAAALAQLAVEMRRAEQTKLGVGPSHLPQVH